MPNEAIGALAPRPPFGGAILLAWRNLAHDRARFAVTMVGVVFAVVLIAVQLGLFLGFTTTITALIDNTRADFWIASRGVQYLEISRRMSERDYYRVLGTPGVAAAEKLVVQFTFWRKPQGGEESVIIVGVDPRSSMSGPWNVVAGSIEDLRAPDAVMIDELYREKLGVSRIGEVVEIRGWRARVVGFTRGIRSFTTSPFVFASHNNALKYADYDAAGTTYVIGRAAAGADPAAVMADLRRRLPDHDILGTAEFSRMTRDYWMFTTGAGMAIVLAAALAFIVGIVVVAQVLYATTIDHLAEFGTLRAIGAPNRFILRIILAQAAIAAILGHAVGAGVALGLARLSEHSPALLSIPHWLAGGLFLVTLGMCVLASVVSVRKALRIDPAMVFQR